MKFQHRVGRPIVAEIIYQCDLPALEFQLLGAHGIADGAAHENGGANYAKRVIDVKLDSTLPELILSEKISTVYGCAFQE